MRIWLGRAMALLIGISPVACFGQGSKAEYVRAETLARTRRDTVFKSKVEPHWDSSGDRFWYRNDLSQASFEYVEVSATTGKIRPAFDHIALADALSNALHQTFNSAKLSLTAVEPFDPGEFNFRIDGRTFRWDLQTQSLTTIDPPPPKIAPEVGQRRRSLVTSPDKTYALILREYNLFLVDRTDGSERALTKDGTEADRYELNNLAWSPDSSRLVAMRTKQGDSRKVNLIESSPRDQLQPKVSDYSYLKPGDQVPRPVPHLFKLENAEEIPIDTKLFENPYSLDHLRWSPDSSRFTFLYNQRGHQVLRIISVDASTGSTTAIVDETSPSFIDYSQKTDVRFIDKTDDLIWMSERSGWNHLYLIDSKTGTVRNPITQGDWVVRSIESINEADRVIWFRAMGIRPGEDPYHVHYGRVDFDGRGLVFLTEGDGTHTVSFSPDRRFLIDTYSRVDLPPITELRRATDGRLICELERADVSMLEKTGWKPPQRFAAKGRDGQTNIHGVVYRPTSFDPSRRYPVIEYIYAGPHDFHVPKSFSATHRPEGMAELGFVMVQIDGMGTNWRSRAFHDICWKNLADAGFPDRILWLKSLAAQESAIDLSKVGIYGGSAGGQNALGALLFHGDFYKAAVADCGCHDNRMDKIWWNEAWMGWPVGTEYATNSNVTNAHKLIGKLLLTVGELDRNVDPASTMQVANALIKADKDFELIVFPGGGHGSGSSPYGTRRMRDFFVRHLHGLEPRKQ